MSPVSNLRPSPTTGRGMSLSKRLIVSKYSLTGDTLLTQKEPGLYSSPFELKSYQAYRNVAGQRPKADVGRR